MTWTKRESDLAAVVVQDLRERGWTVYQEVESRLYASSPSSGVCDIVAVQGRVLWAIECKVSLGLAVLAQARGWEHDANLVSVAVLPGRPSSTRRFATDCARAFGIGVLEVRNPEAGQYADEWRDGWTPVTEIVRPSLRRSRGDGLASQLREEQQHFAAAGNAEGKRYTAFMATCDALRDVLRRYGPMTVRDAVTRLAGRHHYANEASARGSLRTWADTGKIPGVRLEHRGKGSGHALLALVESGGVNGG